MNFYYVLNILNLSTAMDKESAKQFFSKESVIQHYMRASNAVGLWDSEKKIFTRLFGQDDALIELGCGAGRIAFGLWELGYKHILGIDHSKGMISEARRINKLQETGISFQIADAAKIPFEDGVFDGAIFGFNGLMQTPGRENRLGIMAEIFRVVRPGAWFVFTAHDRELSWSRAYWQEQRQLWKEGRQEPGLTEFGDMVYNTSHGDKMYIHAPSRAELTEDLEHVGWRIEVDVLRSALCIESEIVREFSDECRFWVAQKPAA